MLIALHARRSHASIKAFPRAWPLVVVLTGTDVYRDIHRSGGARESLELADRLIVLQPKAAAELPARLRAKVSVVVQSSATGLRHRDEKDPLRTLLALRYVSCPIEVVHLGAALDPALGETLKAARDPRYRWLGGVPHARALRWLASSHAMVISSRMEGGANVVCEALRIGVPVLASRIPGNVGLLGPGYRGYFAPGDERGLARLLERAALERDFYRALKAQVARLRPSVAPRAEARALLAALGATSAGRRA